LALALAQASYIIRTQRLSYQEFLERLCDNRLDQFMIRHTGDAYPRGAAATVLLALEHAEKNGTMTDALLLHLLSVLSPDGVTRELLYTAGVDGVLTYWPWKSRRKVDRTTIDAALGRLAEASLVNFSVDGQTVIMHRFTQRVVRERASGDGILPITLFKASVVITKNCNAIGPGWPHREAVEYLIQQISSIWDSANTEYREGPQASYRPGRIYRRWLVRRFRKLTIGLRIWSVIKLVEAFNPSRVIQLGKSVTEECERILGPEHRQTLTSRDYLAVAYLRTGQYEESIALQRPILASRQRLLGPNHRETLTSTNNLGLACIYAQHFDEAIELYRQLLAIEERILGFNHLHTCIIRSNLACALDNAGQFSEAIELHRQILENLERNLGPDHLETHTSRNNLASAYSHAGRLGEAIDLYRQVLPDLELVVGPDHPYTLVTRTHLACALHSTGQVYEAVELHGQVLVERERLLGSDHPDTIASRKYLAVAKSENVTHSLPNGSVSNISRTLAGEA
jgi:Tetratricopeptide repeat